MANEVDGHAVWMVFLGYCDALVDFGLVQLLVQLGQVLCHYVRDYKEGMSEIGIDGKKRSKK